VFTSEVRTGTFAATATIQRRLLVNATVPVDLLPPALRAADVRDGRALVGVCVVRSTLRPCRLPAVVAPVFEGLAYRVATVDDAGRPGVAVVRRETADHRALLAGRVGAPIVHRRAGIGTAGDLRVTVAADAEGPALVLDLIPADDAAATRTTSVLGGDDQAAAFFGAATTATEHDGARLELTWAPFRLDPRGPRPGVTLVLDRLAWAFGLLADALAFDSAFVARDVPVRLRATAPATPTTAA
jgi:hypothetical protein